MGCIYIIVGVVVGFHFGGFTGATIGLIAAVIVGMAMGREHEAFDSPGTSTTNEPNQIVADSRDDLSSDDSDFDWSSYGTGPYEYDEDGNAYYASDYPDNEDAYYSSDYLDD